MPNRFENAYTIWHHGASNPRGVARALVEAIDDATAQAKGSEGAKDPAVQMILDHLCHLCGLPQPSLGVGDKDWGKILHDCAKNIPYQPGPTTEGQL